MFWLILLQRLKPSQPVERLVTFLQNNGIPEIIGMLIGAFGWGIILSKISDYHTWWQLVASAIFGVYVGQRLFWIIYYWLNYDFSNLPIHVGFLIHLSGLILSITFCTGLSHGMLLRNWKAAVTLASSTAFASVLSTVLAYLILDGLGIRVGTGNAAMPKVTAICTMVAGIFGGTTIGIMFSGFVGETKHYRLSH